MPLAAPADPSAAPAAAWRLHLAAVLVGLGLLASGCSASTLEFTIGDCVNLPDGDTIESFESVDCGQAHDAEVFALPQHPDAADAPYPGLDALNDFATERCRGEFEEYVGVAYEQSEIYFSPLTPSDRSWDEADDREVVCLLRGAPIEGAASSFEQLTGSKQGSGE